MKLFFLLFAMLISLQSHSQNFVALKSKSTGFDISASTKVSTLVIEGKSFDVFQTKSGSQFIKVLNKGGTEYAFWIGTETTQSANYNGKNVKIRQFKSGGLFILTIKNGKPSRIMGSIE